MFRFPLVIFSFSDTLAHWVAENGILKRTYLWGLVSYNDIHGQMYNTNIYTSYAFFTPCPDRFMIFVCNIQIQLHKTHDITCHISTLQLPSSTCCWRRGENVSKTVRFQMSTSGHVWWSFCRPRFHPLLQMGSLPSA